MIREEEKQLEEGTEEEENFICPITLDFMEDPYTAADGFSYEGKAIRQWIETGRRISPKTGQPLANIKLVRNLTLKTVIQDYLARREKEGYTKERYAMTEKDLEYAIRVREEDLQNHLEKEAMRAEVLQEALNREREEKERLQKEITKRQERDGEGYKGDEQKVEPGELRDFQNGSISRNGFFAGSDMGERRQERCRPVKPFKPDRIECVIL